jgi:hypothetical protein
VNLFGWLVPGWVKWAALAAVIAVLVAASWTVNGWRHRAHDADTAEKALADYTAQVATRDSAHARDLAATQKHAEDLAKALTAVADAYAQAQAVVPNLPLVEHHDAPPNPAGRCDVPVRSPVFRMCHNAAWSGDSAALAACGANAGDAAGEHPLPPAGLVRPRDPG